MPGTGQTPHTTQWSNSEQTRKIFLFLFPLQHNGINIAIVPLRLAGLLFTVKPRPKYDRWLETELRLETGTERRGLDYSRVYEWTPAETLSIVQLSRGEEMKSRRDRGEEDRRSSSRAKRCLWFHKCSLTGTLSSTTTSIRRLLPSPPPPMTPLLSPLYKSTQRESIDRQTVVSFLLLCLPSPLISTLKLE
jgi:hypothetical protein